MAEKQRIKELKESDTDSTYIFRIPRSYWIDLKKYDPIKTAAALDKPMLLMLGGRDYQVTETDFNMWKEGLKGKANAEFRIYPSLNHFFIAGEGKSTPKEYGEVGNVDEKVINDIVNWVTTNAK